MAHISVDFPYLFIAFFSFVLSLPILVEARQYIAFIFITASYLASFNQIRQLLQKIGASSANNWTTAILFFDSGP